MAKSRNDILWRFIGDTKSLDKATRRAKGDFKDTEKGATRTSQAIGGMSKAFVALGGAYAGQQAAQFIFDSAKMAEQAGIVSNSFEKIYEENVPALRASLEDVRYQVGLNSLEFEQLLLKTGQLLVGFGSTAEETAAFSEAMFRTAGDLAAFQGDVGLTDEALHALNRALVGEFDPLEQFVGGVKASTVAAKALEMGLAETTAELTDQDKALALLEIVAGNAEDAIGSLAEQEETLASQTLEANARLDDLQIQLGEAVTPALLLATEGTLNFTKGLTFLADESESATDRLGALGGALADIWLWAQKTWISVQPLALLFRGAGFAAEELGKKIGGVVDGLKDLTRSLTTLPNIKLPNFPSVKLPGFAQGGVVPGPEGAPSLAVVHGGEEVRTPQQQRMGNGSGGGTVVNVSFNGVVGDPVAVAQQITDLIELHGRTNGTQ